MVVTIVRTEVSRRKNIFSIIKALKSKLMTDESLERSGLCEYKKNSFVVNLSNSSVSRTMSSLIDSISTAK